METKSPLEDNGIVNRIIINFYLLMISPRSLKDSHWGFKVRTVTEKKGRKTENEVQGRFLPRELGGLEHGCVNDVEVSSGSG